MLLDPETYNFMSNSPTNDKLAPMYTLFENLAQAQEVLKEGSKNQGKISLKNYHAMLDYVKSGESVGEDQIKILEDVEENFDPTLETKLDKETMDEFNKALQSRTAEDVRNYNLAAEANNDFVKIFEEGAPGLLDKDVQFGGDTFKAGVEGEARRLAELAYSTLSVQDSLAVNALAIELRKKDSTLDPADAFAQALAAYNLDSPELAQLITITSILKGIADKYDIEYEGQSLDLKDETPIQKVMRLSQELEASNAALSASQLKIDDLQSEITAKGKQIAEKDTQIAEKDTAITALTTANNEDFQTSRTNC